MTSPEADVPELCPKQRREIADITVGFPSSSTWDAPILTSFRHRASRHLRDSRAGWRILHDSEPTTQLGAGGLRPSISNVH